MGCGRVCPSRHVAAVRSWDGPLMAWGGGGVDWHHGEPLTLVNTINVPIDFGRVGGWMGVPTQVG